MRDLGYETFVTHDGRAAVDWVVRMPRTLAFLDVDLDRVDGEEVWRLVRRIVARPSEQPVETVPGWNRRLVLMAARRTNQIWFAALSEGVGSLLPLPSEREVVRAALEVAGRA